MHDKNIIFCTLYEIKRVEIGKFLANFPLLLMYKQIKEYFMHSYAFKILHIAINAQKLHS